jgi:hypothetical protein
MNHNTNNTINMDVEQLHIILQQSFASEANVRQPAEEIIRHLKHIPGATVLLLQVVSEKQVRRFWCLCIGGGACGYCVEAVRGKSLGEGATVI